MNGQDQQLQPARPRRAEKVWMWIAIGVIVFYLISLLVEIVHLNLAVLAIITIAVLLFLIWALREKPPVNFADCLNACADIEHDLTGDNIPLRIKDAEVIPDGPSWIAFFWHTSSEGYPVAYRFDPSNRAVVGREINDYDAILKRMQENEVLRDIAKARQRKNIQRTAEERAGYETGDDEHEQDD